jgi:very-short-patch-repair endonuclease
MRSIFRVGVPAVKLHREIRNRSRSFRADMTPHERKLWFKLRELNRLGYHFRRQVPFQTYFLDFVEHGAKLVIELDGSQHGQAEHVRKDERRDAILRNEGYLVLRFWNHEVDGDPNAIMDTIVRHLRERSPHPKNPSDFSTSPQGGG